ncbi:hypothetical protein D7Z54_26945 [Salibacterium salarium]|uniref:DUF3278 domain-containing protein n=1 Tax=Salibacterium salarium TaxID=284579 RepID=A0A428MVY6_9BACI|nr:hypothetical protein [Salibacterium salarium]RSL30246.1 hypothetical protein D7Z54_26945 [Salibacterium salarium]
MIKSWFSVFLPEDEYKRQKSLYFFAEASVIIPIFLVVSLLINKLFFSINYEFLNILALGLFGLYILLRYSISGIEYISVSTKAEFNNKKKKTFVQSINFSFIFGLLYLVLVDLPNSRDNWFQFTLLLVVIFILFFTINYISLKKSYQKNMDLMD